MGRKKIEIRPLADERNRNVTFLKRKAGLMKKAWELSVLCAADVSILIFSATGKPFEFSSRDLDSEIDRYLEYEGAIERRRGEEFAAAAAAGEDDSDDDEETSRRGSTANKPGQKSGVVKSLKGKETFKKKMSNRAELARAVERNGGGAKRGFIEGILSDGSEDQSPESADEDRGGAQQYSPRRGEPSDLASLQYALNMHSNASGLPDASSSSHGHAPPELIIPGTSGHYSSSLASNAWNYRMFKPAPESHSHSHSHSSPSHLTPSYAGPSNYPPHVPPMGTVLAHPSHSTPAFQQPQLPQPTPQQQWDPNLLARYAEFQLQQNHQRQQRALLEMQRQQLAELGVPLDDKSLLDDIFGVNAGPSTQGRSMSDGALAGLGPAGGLGADLGMSSSGGDFIWPTVSSKPRSGGGGGRDDEHGGAWGYGLGDEGPFPSPHSTEEARDKRGRDGGHGIPEKRIRVS